MKLTYSLLLSCALFLVQPFIVLQAHAGNYTQTQHPIVLVHGLFGRLKKQDVVVIERGVFNSFLLKVEGQNRSIRVKRTN